jgi:hypothetical protein
MWKFNSVSSRIVSRDVSRRYVRSSAETIAPLASMLNPMYLPKREELSLHTVAAFPNASSIGLICISRMPIPSVRASPWVVAVSPAEPARASGADVASCAYCSSCFIVSVFPAPLSPLQASHLRVCKCKRYLTVT